MKFTLLIATINRPQMLKECVGSLLQQLYTDFEIIIVDQSDLGMESKYLEELDDRIKYIHIDDKGLSHARNIGIDSAKGDYICLIDDDGKYPKDYLSRAKELVERENLSILGVQIIDPVTKAKKWSDIERFVEFKDAFDCFCSPGMVIERSFQMDHHYDERFGVGAKYGSGEETDIVLAAIHEKRAVKYSPCIIISHPVENLEIISASKVKAYSFGYGALCRKIISEYSFFWGLFFFLKTVLGNFVIGFIHFVERKKHGVGRMRLLRAKSAVMGFMSFNREYQ